MNTFAKKTIELALAEDGVREHGRNRGPEVDGYWRDIGMDAGGLSLHPVGVPKAWCAAFVSAMVKRACDALDVPVPVHLTAGVFTLDEQAPAPLRAEAPSAGCIFILGAHKHTGFVSGIGSDGTIYTIEGNTNPAGSSEGDGVYARTRRREELTGFIDLNKVEVK